MPTTLWSELLRLTLAGARNAAVSPTLRARLAELGLTEEELSDSQWLLAAAARVHLLERTARPPAVFGGQLPAPAPAETRAVCSYRSLQDLWKILRLSEYAPILPEFIRLARRHERILPPETLARLLEECRGRPELWPSLASVVGERGHWLIRQHPEWRSFAPPVVEEDGWPSLPLPERRAMLAVWRQQAPAAAREALMRRWAELSPKEKAELLAALAVNLSLEDEDFLEAGLDEGRKEVRAVAADLLAALPGSALLERLFSRALPAWQWQGDHLNIQLPAEPPRESKRDGIRPSGSKAPGGLPLSWLALTVERVPPVKWSAHFQREPASILRALAVTAFGPPLITSLQHALLRHPDETWQAAFFRFLLNQADRPLRESALSQVLVNALPADLYSRVLEQRLGADAGTTLLEQDGLIYFLLSSKHPWSPALSYRLLDSLQRITRQRPSPLQVMTARRLVYVLGYRFDPGQATRLRQDWSLHPGWLPIQADVKASIDTVLFRAEMSKALAG